MRPYDVLTEIENENKNHLCTNEVPCDKYIRIKKGIDGNPMISLFSFSFLDNIIISTKDTRHIV